MEEELERDMTPRLIEDLGMEYFTEKSKYKTKLGIYRCQYCMKEFVGYTYHINSGSTKSCGCQKGKWFKHGLESNRFYNTWIGMIQRCTNSNNKKYKYYGGRGISVCEEWLNVATFIDWCKSTHPNIDNYTLDRIDNDKGYSPENCRWADKTTQALNQRKYKSNTSGFVGICWNKPNKNWVASVSFNSINKHIGSFPTIEEAVQARDNYIIENKLPHKLSTDYKREEA